MSRMLDEALAAVSQLRTENAELREVLRWVEWSYSIGEWEDICPACKHHRRRGHHPDCRLAAALKGSP